MPRDDFNGWIAWKSLCLSEGWIQAAMICSVFHNELELVRSMFAEKYRPKWTTPADYIPGMKKKKGNALRGRSMNSALVGMCVNQP